MEPKQYEGFLSTYVTDKTLGKAKIKSHESADPGSQKYEDSEAYRELELTVLKRFNISTSEGLLEMFPNDVLKYTKLGNYPINTTVIRNHLPTGSSVRVLSLRLRDIKNMRPLN
jgi:hypothetical protein